MSSETPPPTGGSTGDRQKKCPLGEHHIHREEVRRIWRECSEESFWYRALPLSLGSMGVTGGLLYNGIWQTSKRFGPFPKLAVAGVLGYAVGHASYVRTCRSKFQKLGHGFGPGCGQWSGPGTGLGCGPGCGPESGPGNGPGSAPESGPESGPGTGPGPDKGHRKN